MKDLVELYELSVEQKKITMEADYKVLVKVLGK